MNRKIEKHERVMGSEGVIPVSIMHGWRINLATPTNDQWQRRERDDVNDELGPTNITRQPAEYSKVAEKAGEYLGGLGE
jgi:hypothetical protein